MIESYLNTILQGCALSRLPELPKESVNCIVTSPPYWGLRDYGVEPTKWPKVVYSVFGKKITIKAMKCCLGLEPTPEAYVGHLVLIFREGMRVLRKDGTLWLNLGDSYAAAPKNRTDEHACRKSVRKGTKGTLVSGGKQPNKITSKLKPKDLVGIPWMVAFALRDDGWYLRQDIIWHKPNPMPESVNDRCTKAHEYIFLFSRSKKYYYDATAIMVPLAQSTLNDKRLTDETYEAPRIDKGFPGGMSKGNGLLKRNTVGGREHKNLADKGQPVHSMHRTRNDNGTEWSSESGMANKRSVWTVVTKPFPEAHFATFPQELIVPCIKAGSQEGGVILDIFSGAGTTSVVARKLNRQSIGIEAKAEYVSMSNNRLQTELGLFA